MVLRIVSTLVMAIAGLFGLEAAGLVPVGKYFPSLPRLDRETNTPGNWLSAGNWGLNTLSCLTQGKSFSVCTNTTANGAEQATVALPSKATTKESIAWDESPLKSEGDSAANESSSSFTERVAHKG